MAGDAVSDRYVIRRTDGRYYCEDDRGRPYWDIWPTEFPLAAAQRIVATYAPSTRRNLRVEKCWPHERAFRALGRGGADF